MRLASLKKSLIAVSVFLLIFSLGASATELTFVSTQFRPIEEQQFFREEIIQPFIDETGINVLLIAEDYGPFFNRLQIEARSGRNTIDVFGTLHGDFPSLLAEDFPVDLPDLSTLPDRTFIDEFVKLGQMDGKQVYVPWVQATYLMVANTKALEYLPTGADIDALTYDELLAWAKNMYDATGSAKFGLPAGPSGLFGRMIHGYLYPSFTGTQVEAFNSADAVAMWEYLVELFEYTHESSFIYEAMADALLLEEVWVVWDHLARVGPALRETPDQFVAFPSPAGPHGRAFITVLSGLGIPQGAPNFEEAWEFIGHLTHPETQVKVLEGTGFFPTTLEASSYVPEGANLILAEAVTKQSSAPDALISLLPVGLGDRNGEFVPIYKDTFQAIVVMGRDIQKTLDSQNELLLELFESTGAPYPAP